MSQAPGTATGNVSTATDVVEQQAINLVDWLPASVHPLWEIVDQNPVLGALVVALVFFIAAYLVRFL